MANFGLSDLRLVSPREGWPRTGARRKGAYAAAAGAVHLLEDARVFDSVEAAIADLTYVYATTARERGQSKRRRWLPSQRDGGDRRARGDTREARASVRPGAHRPRQ